MDTKELGNLGEKLACEYLVKNRYKIIGKNYRIKFGEIDIIAVKKFTPLNKILRILISANRQKLFNRGELFGDKVIHFVEVKALSQVSGIFSPEQRANWKKQNKVKRLAEIWLSKNKVSENTPYQIDVIAVSFGELGEAEIKHFENIVSET